MILVETQLSSPMKNRDHHHVKLCPTYPYSRDFSKNFEHNVTFEAPSSIIVEGRRLEGEKVSRSVHGLGNLVILKRQPQPQQGTCK